MQVGSVLAITRYPVKSTGGEPLRRVEVTRRGLAGDRVWAVYTPDGGIGSGKTSERFRRIDGLLDLRSRLEPGGPVLELPDGSEVAVGDPDTDRRLSELLGRPVAVRAEGAMPHHDDCPVHLVSTASLRRLGRQLGEPVDPRRTRANLLVEVDGDGWAEDGWTGRLAVGAELVLDLGPGMPRCVMVNAAQPGLRQDSRLLKLLAREHGLDLGLQAGVARTGTIAVGDPVLLDRAATGPGS
jgi:MOSC domain-containing protein